MAEVSEDILGHDDECKPFLLISFRSVWTCETMEYSRYLAYTNSIALSSGSALDSFSLDGLRTFGKYRHSCVLTLSLAPPLSFNSYLNLTKGTTDFVVVLQSFRSVDSWDVKLSGGKARFS